MASVCPFCGLGVRFNLNGNYECDEHGPVATADLLPEEVDDVRQLAWSEGISRESREYIDHDEDLEYWESLKKGQATSGDTDNTEDETQE